MEHIPAQIVYQPLYTQKIFCNITVVFGGCLVAQNIVAEIWSNAW